MDRIRRSLSLRRGNSKKRSESVSSKRSDMSAAEHNPQNPLELDLENLNLRSKPPFSGDEHHHPFLHHPYAEAQRKVSERYQKLRQQRQLIEQQQRDAVAREKATEEVLERAARSANWLEMRARINFDISNVYHTSQSDELELVMEIAEDMYNHGELSGFAPPRAPKTEFSKLLQAEMQREVERLDLNQGSLAEKKRPTGSQQEPAEGLLVDFSIAPAGFPFPSATRAPREQQRSSSR